MRPALILAMMSVALCTAPALAKMTPVEQAVVLDVHNRERAAVGVAPIAWNARLAADAERWAAHLAQINGLIHYRTAGEPENGEGENLFMGTARAYRIDEMVGLWASEKRAFRRARRWDQDGATFEAVGHYTQMVWRTTREVGCAIASNGSDDFLVCRYAQPGNMIGQKPF